MINEQASHRFHIIDWEAVQRRSELALAGSGAHVLLFSARINPTVISQNTKVTPVSSEVKSTPDPRENTPTQTKNTGQAHSFSHV